METKLILVTLFCLFHTLVIAENSDGIKFEFGGKSDRVLRSIHDAMKKTPNSVNIDDNESGDGPGSGGGGGGIDDEDEEGPFSGSGSGSDKDTTEAPKVTGIKSTPKIVVINTGTSKPATTEDDENENVIDVKTTRDPNNVEASTGDKTEKAGVKFTIGIIVGVVVGAVLAILVIVFLVYRLRKKDEGSYSLDEQSSQAFIRDDKSGQGKEYFA